MDREREVDMSGTWSAVAGLAFLAGVWMNAAGLSLDVRSALPVAAWCLVFEGLARFYRWTGRDERFVTALTLTAQLIAFTAAGACLSYAAGATGGALWDRTLMAWDEALGLDWRAYLAAVDSRPALGLCFALAYRSLLPQMLVVAFVLGFRRQTAEARRFVTACVLAIVATCVLFHLMPALGIFAHLGLKAGDVAHIDPVPAYGHLPTITALRDGTMRLVALDRIEGIIPFPSFHTALAVLFMRGLWHVRGFRWPGVALNLMLIASTPIEGGHYFVDVLAGIAVAIVAIGVADKLAAARDGVLSGVAVGQGALQADIAGR